MNLCFAKCARIVLKNTKSFAKYATEENKLESVLSRIPFRGIGMMFSIPLGMGFIP